MVNIFIDEIFQENDESRTDAVSGEGDLITKELGDIHLCSCMVTLVTMVRELLTCRASSLPNEPYVYS